MLICTNENNPATLKLLVASQISGQKHELKLQNNLNDRSIREPGHLPYLEIGEVTFFISNSALWYLLPPSPGAIESQVTEWLELEALHLAPNLCQLGSKSEKVKSNVNAVLVRLDGVLADKAYLVDNKLSAADVAIWASLYPLFKEGGISKDYSNVEKWMVNLSGNSHFKAALDEFPINGASPAYQALANGSKYLQAEISEKRPLDSNTARISESNTSPQHQPEVVTNEELEAAAKAWSSKEVTLLHKPSGKILPKEGKKNILITSALPYVNNVPHLGNIIGCVLSADVFARYCRLCNHNTLFIGGTDEYGTATETKALEEGLSCQAICDKYYAIHKDIYDWFNISFELFGRSSSPNQTTITQDMFLQLNSNGFMFTEAVEQLHCEKCNKFLADRFVEGGCPHLGCNYEDARGDQCDGCGKLVNAVELKNPRCKICSNTPKLKTSTQFFIDLPKLEPLLLHWMKTSSPGWSNNAQVIAKTWLRDGLKPRCITRDLKWGVPVPLHDYRDKVFYVWFDAPIGYMSITKTYTEQWENWWRPRPQTEITLYQFMAKDNVPFHSVMFPASLLGCNRGYITVSHIMATEYLNYEDGKFSKSRGVGVFGNDARDTGIPSDVWRFYLLYVRPESQDSSFSWADLATKNNSELLNNLGNFINRGLVFAKNNFNGTVPEIKLTKDDLSLLVLCTRELKGYVACLEKAKLRDGLRHILSISRHGNQYMQSNQPWVLLKGTPEEKERAGTVIGVCCNVTCLLAMLIEPYLPQTSTILKKQLNAKDTALNPERVEINQLLPTGHKLGEPSPLFAKLEPTRVEELKAKFAGKQNGNGNGNPTLQNGVASNGDVTSLEAEVAKQADKVRALKSSGADKSVWQPEVAALLDLKKKLEAAQKAPPAAQAAKTVAVGPETVKFLEEAVSKQGLVVRKLKEGGADKSVWQPEVAVLLDLKKKLEAAQKAPPAEQVGKAVAVDPEDVKFLEEAVSKQGLVVRKLKESGADKSVWQPEVNKLLALKAKHAALAGTPPAAPAGKKGKKK